MPSGECATPAAGIAHTRLSPEPFSEGKTMAGHKLPLNLGHRFPFILPSKGAKRATGSQISHLEITTDGMGTNHSLGFHEHPGPPEALIH